jgi:hypothetical protein
MTQWGHPHRVLGERSTRTTKPASEASYGYLPGVCVQSFVACVASASPIFVPELKGEFLGGRSHSSATMIIHQSAMGPVTPPDPTLAVPLAVSTDHHINVPLSSLRPAVVCQEALLLGDSG